MKTIVAFLFCLGLFSIPAVANADLVINSISGNVFSEFDSVTDSDASTQLTINIVSNVAANNSFTNAAANWAWNSNTLSGSSLVTAEKTVSARPGGDHLGSSSLAIEFTVTGETNYSFGGTWGVLNGSGTDDFINLELAGTSGVLVNDSSTGTAGVNSDTFGSSGQLSAGTYTFTINSQLIETINNQGTSEAGWTLDFFTLSPIAVPEPTASVAGLPMLLMLIARRRRA